MAVEFDPAWEYREADPEIAELMACEAVAADHLPRVRDGREAVGFRFAKTVSAVSRGAVREAKPNANCETCHKPYLARRRSQAYCSHACRASRPRVRTLDYDRIATLHAQGLSQRKICDMLGVSSGGLRRALKAVRAGEVAASCF